MKRALSLKRREAFCLAYMGTMNGSQAAIAAGYCQKNPRNARIMAWFLLKQPAVQARLAEMAEATADEAIMTVVQRKVRLSEIARASYNDKDRDGDPIVAIVELNKMDGVYRNKGEVAAPGGQSTVVVVKKVPQSGKGKQEEASG